MTVQLQTRPLSQYKPDTLRSKAFRPSLPPEASLRFGLTSFRSDELKMGFAKSSSIKELRVDCGCKQSHCCATL